MVLKIVWSPAKSYSIVPEPVKLEPKSGVTAANFKVPAAVKVINPPPLALNVPSVSKIPAGFVKSKVPPFSIRVSPPIVTVWSPGPIVPPFSTLIFPAGDHEAVAV